MAGEDSIQVGGFARQYAVKQELSGRMHELQKKTIDILSRLSKWNSENNVNVDPSNMLTHETEITDKAGNLKEGVGLEAVLRQDGTLKPGWIVDDNGVPHYSIDREIEENLKEEKRQQAMIPDNSFGPTPEILDKSKVKPVKMPNPLLENSFEMKPKYIIQDGKLVPAPQKSPEEWLKEL